MPTLSSVLKAERPKKRITFPLVGAKSPDAGGFDGPTVEVDIQILTPGALALAHERAATFAEAHGGKADEGDTSYALAYRGHLLVAACLDVDTGAPFFDGGFDQIMSADGLTDGLGDTLAGSTPHFTVGLGRQFCDYGREARPMHRTGAVGLL